MLGNHFKTTDIYDVICENISRLNGNTTKIIFDKSQSIKRPPNVLKMFIPRTYFDTVTFEVQKITTKIDPPSEYYMRFPEEKEVFQCILVSVLTHDKNKMGSGHYYFDVLDFNTGILWHYNDETGTEWTVLPDNVYCVSPLINKTKKRGKFWQYLALWCSVADINVGTKGALGVIMIS